MAGLGTIVNMIAIIAGGLAGTLFGNRLPERFQDILLQANGLAVIFIGIIGTVEKALVITGTEVSSRGTMMMIASLSIGALIGELLNVAKGMEDLGGWLRSKSGSQSDSRFIEAFVVSTCTVCIGAMAIVGSIEDGITADHSILFAKSILDFVIIMVMSASMGRGCIFSALPVGLLQGSVTLAAGLLRPLITDAAVNALSLVGSVLIFCVGVNLVFGKRIKVGNLLPALIIAVLWSIFL